MKFLKWTALAVCTAAAFAVGAAGAGYAQLQVMGRYLDAELTAHASADATYRVRVLKGLREGRQDEAKELMEEKLDRAIVRLSGMMGSSLCEGERARETLKRAARYREEHPRESGNPETDRMVREALSRATGSEP